MAFTIRHLSVVGYTDGFTLWHYNAKNSGDTREVIKGADYFVLAADMLAHGDRIMVAATDGPVDLYVASHEGAPIRVIAMAEASV
jgi:hypothetical protein